MANMAINLSTAVPQRMREDLQSAFRLSDLLSRVPLDYRVLLQPANEAALRAASDACRRCDQYAACDGWLARHEEGEDNRKPSFCPVIAGLCHLSSGRPIAFAPFDRGASLSTQQLRTEDLDRSALAPRRSIGKR